MPSTTRKYSIGRSGFTEKIVGENKSDTDLIRYENRREDFQSPG